MIAQILTPWVGNGQAPRTAYRPQLMDVYPVISYTDMTGQPTANIIPGVNLFAAQFELDAATLAAIEADSNYLVLWSE